MDKMLGVRAIDHKWGFYSCCGAHGGPSLKPASRRSMRAFEDHVWRADPENDQYIGEPDDYWERDLWNFNWVPPTGVYTSESGKPGYWDGEGE